MPAQPPSPPPAPAPAKRFSRPAAAAAAAAAGQQQPTKPPTPTTAAAATRTTFSTWPKWKKYTLTGLFATVIISGAVWGASLKMQSEAKAETQKAKEADADDKIFLLEQRRAYLLKQRGEIESKLSDLHARVKARESGLTSR
ncbi:hypothetical protein QBC47DRAFT_138073 [Echria macrotheca]|uniref:Uncharacterized protein n=1 Tax=Echria macrotheca TaxID=438768 RepID=A0AAJ0F8U0_9PEZI|nr:hypothetical protein QBC47DRAFT_138073 [Echria macrotheca]